jgi:hypothetical protein
MRKPELTVGASVIVSRPRSFQGGVGPWLGRKGRLKTVSRSKRCVTLVLEGERDELWFFSDELDLI